MELLVFPTVNGLPDNYVYCVLLWMPKNAEIEAPIRQKVVFLVINYMAAIF